MCGGTAESALDSTGLWNKENSIFENILNVAIGVPTSGLLGFESGKGVGGITTGAAVKTGIMGLKEVTGANTAEEALKDSRKAAEESKLAALEARENAKAKNAADAIARSRQASTVRSTRGISSGVNKSSTSSLGGTTRDFLGL